MTSHVGGYRLRERSSEVVVSGRRLPSPLTGRFKQMKERAETAVAEPFQGITADGTPELGLFPLRRTGVSTRPIVDAAEAFLASLPEDERAAARFPIDAAEWRTWHNIHPFLFRHGACLDTLNAAQREAALALMTATLSTTGFELARDIMRLNETVGEITGRWDEYGEWLYWLSIFGTPSSDQAWGWQLDGHHLIINCSVLGDQVVLTPAFMGAEPVVATSGRYAGTRVFDAEQRGGVALMRALTPAQRRQATLFPSVLPADLPPERLHGPDGRMQAAAFRDNVQLPYEGLPCAGLLPDAQRRLLDLIETYVGRLRPEHAQITMDDVQRQIDRTHFVWMGRADDDSLFYYRVHSPVILIEFDFEAGVVFDDDRPMRDHIHTVVRTPNGNDYGKDWLRQHRQRFHQPNGTDR